MKPAINFVGGFYPALGGGLHQPARLSRCFGNMANKSNSVEALCKLLQDGLEIPAGNDKPGTNHVKLAKGKRCSQSTSAEKALLSTLFKHTFDIKQVSPPKVKMNNLSNKCSCSQNMELNQKKT